MSNVVGVGVLDDPQKEICNIIKMQHNYNEIYSIPRLHYVLKEILKL